jgi:hypothetical protein
VTLVAFAIAAVAVALAVIGAVFYSRARSRPPELTRGALAEAESRWQTEGPKSYTLRFRKRADRLGDEVFVAKVENGKVVELSLNDAPLGRPNDDSYSVAGLFDTMHRELEMAEAGPNAEGSRRGALLKARFDERLGLPLVFEALAGNGRSFFLEVLSLESPGRGAVPSGPAAAR